MQPVTKSSKKSSYRKSNKGKTKSNRPCQPHRLHVKRIHTLSSFQRCEKCSFRSHRKCPMCTHRHRMALFTQQHLEVWNFSLFYCHIEHFIRTSSSSSFLMTVQKTQWESWKMWTCRKRNKEMKAAAHGVFFFSCQTRECEFVLSTNKLYKFVCDSFHTPTRDARLISSIFCFYSVLYIWNWTHKKAHVYHIEIEHMRVSERELSVDKISRVGSEFTFKNWNEIWKKFHSDTVPVRRTLVYALLSCSRLLCAWNNFFSTARACEVGKEGTQAHYIHDEEEKI